MNKFKIGDKVVFKTWEEMEKEFGVDNVGSIQCFPNFTIVMRKFLNPKRVYTITKRNCYGFVLLSPLDYLTNNYNIGDDMLKKVEDMNTHKENANPNKVKLHISSDGVKFVNAFIEKSGERVKHSVARCHPDDIFDLRTGIDVALDRLLGERKEVEEKPAPKEVEPMEPKYVTRKYRLENSLYSMNLEALDRYDYYTQNITWLKGLGLSKLNFQSIQYFKEGTVLDVVAIFASTKEYNAVVVATYGGKWVAFGVPDNSYLTEVYSV